MGNASGVLELLVGSDVFKKEFGGPGLSDSSPGVIRSLVGLKLLEYKLLFVFWTFSVVIPPIRDNLVLYWPRGGRARWASDAIMRCKRLRVRLGTPVVHIMWHGAKFP